MPSPFEHKIMLLLCASLEISKDEWVSWVTAVLCSGPFYHPHSYHLKFSFASQSLGCYRLLCWQCREWEMSGCYHPTLPITVTEFGEYESPSLLTSGQESMSWSCWSHAGWMHHWLPRLLCPFLPSVLEINPESIALVSHMHSNSGNLFLRPTSGEVILRQWDRGSWNFPFSSINDYLFVMHSGETENIPRRKKQHNNYNHESNSCPSSLMWLEWRCTGDREWQSKVGLGSVTWDQIMIGI